MLGCACLVIRRLPSYFYKKYSGVKKVEGQCIATVLLLLMMPSDSLISIHTLRPARYVEVPSCEEDWSRIRDTTRLSIIYPGFVYHEGDVKLYAASIGCCLSTSVCQKLINGLLSLIREVFFWYFVSSVFLAWENSRHFAAQPLVSPRIDDWETSAEIPYWWRVTTQIWVVLLSGRGTGWEICFIQSEALPRSE